jgi:hypothetical protein
VKRKFLKSSRWAKAEEFPRMLVLWGIQGTSHRTPSPKEHSLGPEVTHLLFQRSALQSPPFCLLSPSPQVYLSTCHLLSGTHLWLYSVTPALLYNTLQLTVPALMLSVCRKSKHHVCEHKILSFICATDFRKRKKKNHSSLFIKIKKTGTFKHW